MSVNDINDETFARIEGSMFTAPCVISDAYDRKINRHINIVAVSMPSAILEQSKHRSVNTSEQTCASVTVFKRIYDHLYSILC